MKRKYIPIMILVASLLSVESVFASGPKLGTAGGVELLIPMGARNVALGGANIANIGGTEAMYWNPAGLAQVPGRLATFSYMNYFADMNVSYLAAGSRVGRFGVFGMSFQSLDIGKIPVTTIDMPEGTGEEIEPDFLNINLTYAKRFTDRINFGTNAKVISEKIGTMSASAFAFDFGLQYVSPWGVSFGVAMRNLGSTIQFDGTGIEFDADIPFADPNATTRKTKLDMASHELPASLNMGVAYSMNFGSMHQINLSGIYGNNSYTLDHISAGIEYGFNELLFVRGGYQTVMYPDDYPNAAEESQFGLSFGFGLNFDLGGNAVMFDYANRPMDIFNNVQYFSISFEI